MQLKFEPGDTVPKALRPVACIIQYTGNEDNERILFDRITGKVGEGVILTFPVMSFHTAPLAVLPTCATCGIRLTAPSIKYNKLAHDVKLTIVSCQHCMRVS